MRFGVVFMAFKKAKCKKQKTHSIFLARVALHSIYPEKVNCKKNIIVVYNRKQISY